MTKLVKSIAPLYLNMTVISQSCAYRLSYSVLGYSDVPSAGCKGYNTEYPESAADYVPVHQGLVNGSNHPELGYQVFEPQNESAADEDVSKDQPMSEENLRESLKKQLEFCFSR